MEYAFFQPQTLVLSLAGGANKKAGTQSVPALFVHFFCWFDAQMRAREAIMGRQFHTITQKCLIFKDFSFF